jgi:ATP-dependent DNA helicase DinG
MIAPLDEWPVPLPAEVKKIFSPEGALGQAKKFEARPQQAAMAIKVAEQLAAQGHLLVEAGTGVGKSLAYLIPSVLHGLKESRKIVISTHTINLQEQLFHKDIPIVRKLIAPDLQAVLLKGRRNYLCPHRLARARQHAPDLFLRTETQELERIWKWSLSTEDGTLSDFDRPPDMKVWSQVASEAGLCTSRTCGEDLKCGYQQARKRAIAAHLIVVNHSLFFNWLAGGEEDLTEDEEGFLFPRDFVIFDEAHTLESVAQRHLGIDVSSGSLRRLLHALYHPRTKKGLLAVLRHGETVQRVTDALDAADLFFAHVESAAPFGNGKEARITKPDLTENLLFTPLARLARALTDIGNELKDESSKVEVMESARQVDDTRNAIVEFLSLEKSDHVYWVEKETFGHPPDIRLIGAPVEVAPYLRRLLFRGGESVILTSATLSVSRGLKYFQSRIGGEAAATLQVDSPFDYGRQMKIYLPRHMPEPSQRAQYETELSRWILHFVTLTKGRAFVLFTSYATMRAVAVALESALADAGLESIVQGGALARHKMLQRFKEDRGSVLFGTDSFWQGVDVPGEALSNVIITRLPFAVPDHPLTQAKLELIISRGGDPFREYSLPEAILKFRQGVGRLIRTQQDKGIIVVLDNRILSKPYGKSFLAVLPECPVEVVDPPWGPDPRRQRKFSS